MGTVQRKRLTILGGILAAAIGTTLTLPLTARAEERFTEWGWPQPYEKVSEKSMTWLKDKGWWPLQVAFQAPWSGQNTINVVMDRMQLLQKRGVEAKWQAFPSGPAINEVMVSGRFQVGNGGNFPFTSMLDKKIPVKTIAIVSPNLLHALVVPKDSALKSFKDLKSVKGETPTIGLATGSSAEFYVQAAAKANGVEIGKDVILKNMPPSEQLQLPKGLAGIAGWDSTPAMMVEERKNGKIIDSIYPYNMYEGNFYVRQEIIDNAPDVVQALSDAFTEAVLWTRRYPERAADLMTEDPHLKNFPKSILRQQIRAYNNLYKPTVIYPHGQFWGEVNESIYKWLYENKRIQNDLKAGDFAAAVDPSFMNKTFEKLGWAIQKQPSFIPEGWKGSPANPPYPEYITPLNTKEPQPFPEKGDLTREWQFAGKTYKP